MTADWVILAAVTQPHGVNGQLKVKSFCDPAEGFARYALTDRAGRPVKLAITGQAQGLQIVRIEGVADRNAAELWRGKELGISRSALPQLKDESAHYIADLEGMEVVDAAGQPIGRIAGIANYGAGDLVDIAFADGRQEFYSFTDSNFPSIDHTARRITFIAPELLGSRSEEGDA